MVGLIMYKILVVITVRDGYSDTRSIAITSQVIEFDTLYDAQVAYASLAYNDGFEVYKLYK